MSVMLFLTLAFAFGAFFSITARTVNAAVEDRIRYRAGADLVIEPLWSRQPAAAAGGPAGYRYVEPDLRRYAGIDGIEGVTGVLRRSGVTAVIGGGRGTVVELMAVVPDGFAEVAWFRAGLLPAHRHHYLNVLAADPRAMLLSTTLQRAYGIELGAPVSLTWAGQAPLAGHAAAFVDFWPAYDPHRDHLVVANLAYVHARMQIEPYELWAERARGVDNRTILDGIDRAGVRISALTDTGAQVSAARREPAMLGLNGTLTIGFLLVTGVAAAAFVIAAAISLRSRQAELAVIRSIGLSRRRVVAMAAWEQFLVALSAVVVGVVLGAVARDLRADDAGGGGVHRRRFGGERPDRAAPDPPGHPVGTGVMRSGAARVRMAAAWLALLPALSGCLFPREEEPLAPPLVRPAVITYRTVPALRTTIEQTVVVTGHVTYRTQSAVAFERGGGRLLRIAVGFDERVRAGDLLAELRNEDLRVRLREREIALRKAELHHERARATGADRIETELAALDVELAALHLEAARRDLLGTELRAPMDGVVTYTLPAAPGDHLDPFVTVVRLADPAALVVEYRGAEADRFELGVEV